MNMDLLFAKEIAASGLLAMYLDQCPDIRRKFLDRISSELGNEVSKELQALKWSVFTEKDGNDIQMISDNGQWRIIIENKIQPHSITKGQLKKYYLKQVEDSTNTGIIMVYLAPRSLGQSQCNGLKADSAFRQEMDVVSHLSWDEIDEIFNADLVDDIQERWLLVEAIEAVKRRIDAAQRDKFENVGHRKKIYDLVSKVRQRLDGFEGVGFMGIWPNERFIGFSTKGTDVTLHFMLEFRSAGPNFQPVDLVVGDKMKVSLHAKLHVSNQGRRRKDVVRSWKEITGSGSVEIVGAGVFKAAKHDDWIHFKPKAFVGTEKELTQILTDIGKPIIGFITQFEN